MQLEWYEHFADGCFRDTPPPCSSACPLGLDVRKFTEKAAEGKWNSAYRIYREHVLFPGIVSTVCHKPCSRTCVRKRLDEAVDLKSIEYACHEKASSKPRKFKLPDKTEHIAVIGAGLDGLSCALRLASHGYTVTVFDMNEQPGGIVLDMMDPAECCKDIELSFSIYDRAYFEMGHKVSSADELADFDAVYIAVTRAWQEELADVISSGREGFFVTGAAGQDVPPTERMACGLNAADHIEFWFQLGDKAEYTELYGSTQPDSRYYDLAYDLNCKTGGAEEAGDMTAESEAARCFGCNCDECYKVCPVMQRDKQFPPRMTSYVIGTIWPNATRRPGVKMLAGCTMCGKCGEACPENIDMGVCFREARKDLHERGHFAPAYHDYWMQELEFVQSDEAYLLYCGDGPWGDASANAETAKKTASMVFFPGCQLGASDPELVKKSYEFLQKTCDDPALLLSCCGIAAEWAGDDKKRAEITDRIRDEWEALGRPVFVTGCSACRTNLSRYLPEIETVSLYRLMADHIEELPYKPDTGNVAAGADTSRKTIIYDPCGSGGDEDTRSAVRDLTKKAGLSAEKKSDVKLPPCCGFGGHIYPANPDIFDAMDPELPEDAELTVYCANCRDAFAAKGHKVRHILEILFGTGDNDYRTPDLNERRENRRKLRSYYTGEIIVGTERRYSLEIPEELREKLERLLILEQQIYETLEAAEDTKEKFLDRESGLYYASRRFRNMTVWISYSELPEGGFVLQDVYRHRVEIKE